MCGENCQPCRDQIPRVLTWLFPSFPILILLPLPHRCNRPAANEANDQCSRMHVGFPAEKRIPDHTLDRTAVPKPIGWKPGFSGCGLSHWPQISFQHKQLFCPSWEQEERERKRDRLLYCSTHPSLVSWQLFFFLRCLSKILPALLRQTELGWLGRRRMGGLQGT